MDTAYQVWPLNENCLCKLKIDTGKCYCEENKLKICFEYETHDISRANIINVQNESSLSLFPLPGGVS